MTAVLNVPLIADTLAVRAVIYNDRRGGYIDNVPGTFTRKNSDVGIYYANNPGGGVPADAPAINNYAIAGRAHQSGDLHGNPRRGVVSDQR